ncbi:MAG: hypothetical protein JW863_18585 [Chitinispirillaceae bacterium]|nr:hypothetical protein [Chitinispirillaceae bacterium]
MIRFNIPLLLLLLSLVLSSRIGTGLFADVAPPSFPGYSLSPFDAGEVYMKSENVDIYYGSPCRVEAVFEIINPTKEMVKKKIGFPHHIAALSGRGRDTGTIYDFTLSLNGVNQKETDRPKGRSIRTDTHYWYGWTCGFNPGKNVVKLIYHTVSGFGNSGYRWEKTLYYNMNSSKNWPEKIDEVNVTIHFSENIDKKQVLAATSPSEYEIKEKRISWHFTSFTPALNNDIALHFIDFKIFADMLRYEKFLTTPCKENAEKLQAAQFFANLAPVKGIQMDAPGSFERLYYEKKVLPNLKSDEQYLFKTTYGLHKGFRSEDYYRVDNYQEFRKNDSLQRRILQVMDRIGYFEKIVYPTIYRYIKGAKKLFDEVVTSEPENTAAWIAYINSYYLIESGACSPCLPWSYTCDCPASQKELVREAYRHCGNDGTIALWYSYLFPVRTPLPDTIELVRYEKSPEKVTFKIKSGEHGWTLRTLYADEYNLLMTAYTRSGDVFLLSNTTRIDDAIQKRLIDVLGCSCHQKKFCRDLKKFGSNGK